MLSSQLLFLAAVLVFAGCKQDEAPAPAASTSPRVAATAPTPGSSGLVNGPNDPSGGRPQPKLPVLKLWVGTNQVAAELAATHQQIFIGMMRRTNMAEMDGMLFIFPVPEQRAFYMRNTLIPLSCAYIDPEGTILEIYDMKPLDESAIPSKSDQVQYVLEMKQGWFERHGIKPGVAISSERGPLSQVFRK